MSAAQLVPLVLSMSSQEIAGLTDKRHDNVVADVKKMLVELGEDALKFQGIYFDSMNRQQTEYLLDRELTDTLLTGYSAVLRRKVVARWRELEGQAVVAVPVKAMTTGEMFLQSAQTLVSIERRQCEQEAAVVRIDQRVSDMVDNMLMLARPAGAESIVHIRTRINKLHGLPVRVIDEVMRQSPIAPKPAGMVKNSREEAQGGSYAVYWAKDVSAVFVRFVTECVRGASTRATHPYIEGKFKLGPGHAARASKGPDSDAGSGYRSNAWPLEEGAHHDA